MASVPTPISFSGYHVRQLPAAWNAGLAALGLRGRFLITDLRGGNFSRLSTTPEERNNSYAVAAGRLGVEGFSLPAKISPVDDLIVPSRGIGNGPEGENVNPVSMGQSATPDDLLRHHMALALAYGDAMQIVVIDLGTCNATSVAMHWPMLGNKPVEAGIAELRRLNPSLDYANLVVMGSPVARHDFFIDKRGVGRLEAVDPEVWKYVDVVGDPEVDERPFDLDLGRFSKAQIIRAGVHGPNIWWDTRNTVTTPELPSKRADDNAGIPYRSGLIAFAVSAL